MYIVLTEEGIKRTKLAALKFHTSTKGWICNSAGYVYNFNSVTTSISNSICNSMTYYTIDDYEDMSKYDFSKEEHICSMPNCFCGADIGIPKGKTAEDLLRFKKLYAEAEGIELWRLPVYESGEIIAMGDTDYLDAELVHVDWMLCTRCNYDCWYCSPTIHDKHSALPTYEHMFKEYKFIREIVMKHEKRKAKRIRLNISGGEPSMIKGYAELLEDISKDTALEFEIVTATNMSAKPDVLLKMNKFSNIVGSVHLAHMSDRAFEIYEEVLSRRDESHKDFLVKIMYDKEHTDRLDRMYAIAKKYDNISLAVNPLHIKSDKTLMEYTERDKKYINLRIDK